MPLVRRRVMTFPLKHMSQVSTTIRAQNLRPRHAERVVRVPRHRARNAVEVRGPAAAGLELVVRLVEGRLAGGAVVDAGAGHVLVVLAGVGRLGALFADDAELLCREDVLVSPTLNAVDIPARGGVR